MRSKIYLSWLISALCVQSFLMGAEFITPVQFCDGNGVPIEITLSAQQGDSLYFWNPDGWIIIYSTIDHNYKSFKIRLPKEPPSNITNISPYKSQKLLLAGKEKFYIADLSKGLVGSFLPSLSAKDLLQIATLDDIVVLLYEKKLMIANLQIWKTILRAEETPFGDFLKMHIASDGTIWVVAKHGLISIRNNQIQKYNATKLFKGVVSDLTSDEVGDVYVLVKSKLWRYNGTEWRLIQDLRREGNLFIDLYSNIWIYDSNNIHVFSQGSVFPIDIPELVRKEKLQFIFKMFPAETYLVTPNHLFRLFENNDNITKIIGQFFQTFHTPLTSGQLLTLQYPLKKLWGYTVSMKESDLFIFLKSWLLWGILNPNTNYPLSQFEEQLKKLQHHPQYKELLELYKFYLQTNFPERAVLLQEQFQKLTTHPNEIIQAYYDLGELYESYGKPYFAKAIREFLINQFSIKNEKVNWSTYLFYQKDDPHHSHQRINVYQDILQNTQDPLLQKLIDDEFCFQSTNDYWM
ncbi:MAG: hypothetical protein D6813_09575, partial [Calditrichaeota bacterium]